MMGGHEWDWEISEKRVAIKEWEASFGWVEEPYASPDGETVAAIVNVGEMEFSVCANGKTWDTPFDKVWNLRYLPDGRLAVLVSEMGEWTAAFDGIAWDTKFGYVWNPLCSDDGRAYAVAAQQDMRYCMVLNGEPWNESFANMTYFALSPCGTKTAAAVQVENADSGEIHKFKQGTFTAALDGKAW